MNEDYFFSNNSFEEHEEENILLFSSNQSPQFSPFQNLDNNLIYNQDLNNYQKNCDNFILNLDNSFKLQKSLSQDNNNLNEDLKKQISPIPIQRNEDSYKQQIYSNNNNSSIPSNNSPSTKDKNQFKNELNNNSNHKNLNEKDKKEEKNVLTKKRKPRIHLEDLNIEPEIIRNKKFEKIGDKVFTSKYKIITDDDRKEIKAMRNRISAQKSRDRKKAEFISLQENVKYLKEQLERKILIIQSYEKIACSQCKSKMNEINKKFLEDNNINNNFLSEQSEIPVENKEGLVIEENNSILSEKKNGKISGVLIGLVCLIGIIICIFGGEFSPLNKCYIKPQLTDENSNGYSLRHLNNEKNKNEINYNENDINAPLPLDSIGINNDRNDFLQVCHDKFTLDMIANSTKQKRQKNGILMKKKYNKGSLIENRICFETNNTIRNNYIINNSLSKNTLPIESNNIILNNILSNKIISVLVKEYDELKRCINGKYLSLKEQIEIEAKNSEDGCAYLQMILPKNNFDNSNGTISEYENDFFEIRCKILAYKNYCDREPTSD